MTPRRSPARLRRCLEAHVELVGARVQPHDPAFKLSERMEVLAELASRSKFARQTSKPAGIIRGFYFAFDNAY